MTEPIEPRLEINAPRVTVLGRDPFDAVRPNPLRKYASSTYNIKFGFMTPSMLRRFINDNDYSVTNKNILIASGGIPRKDRHPLFDVDFYLEDLEIEHVIGLNAMTRVANSTLMTFRIVEPNGFTFFNRIFYLCKEVNIPNYLRIPYFLKIRFQGWDDKENSNQYRAQSPEFIVPIMLSQVKSTVSTSGSEYMVEAAAFYDFALHDQSVTIKPEITIKAKQARGFFDTLSFAINEYNEECNTKLVNESVCSGGGGFTYDSEQYYDTVKFELDREIAESLFSPTAVTQTGTVSKDPKQQLKGGVDASGVVVDIDSVSYRMPNGSNIVDIVDNVLKTSSYITDQQVDIGKLKAIQSIPNPKDRSVALSEFADSIKKPLNWYKIRPIVKLKEYNPLKGQYAKDITYQIKVYKIHNGKDMNFPGWGESPPVKKYDYIFTGLNEDIIDFSIKFDTLYHLIIIANANKNTTTGGYAESVATLEDQTTQASENPTLPTAVYLAATGGVGYSHFPMVQSTLTNEATRISYNSGANKKAQLAAALSTNVVPSAQGDMVEVDLEIIGDPEFLVGYNEQDFLIRNKQVLETIERTGRTRAPVGELDNMPSLSSLDIELNCYLSFKTPQDYNPNTGLLLTSKETGFVNSIFDGVYKIVTVKSKFNTGTFRQSLTCTRLPNQTKDFQDFQSGLAEETAAASQAEVKDSGR